MANKNLKVNSKSTVLEHKRKHNLLVDEVMSEDKEILGDLTIGGELSVQGDATIGGNSRVAGEVEIDDDLSVGGNAFIFESIVDKDGHKRFVEGNGTPSTKEGITTNYCKWSLSGSHLMLVVAGSIADTTQIVSSDVFGTFELPEWITNKIIPVFNNSYIEARDIKTFDDNWGNQSLGIGLEKISNGVRIRSVANVTLTANRHFRFSYDLLIDNE